MSEPFYVYGLLDPRTGELRYIGKTDDPKRRLSHHCGQRRRARVGRWVTSLKRAGLRPLMEILEQWNTNEESATAENELISYYRMIGCNLVNHTDGGEGSYGYRHTAEARKAMSQLKLGRKLPPSHRAAMSAAQQGKHTGILNPQSKLTASDVLMIRARYAAGERQADLAREYNVKDSTIHYIRTRKAWRHV